MIGFQTTVAPTRTVPGLNFLGKPFHSSLSQALDAIKARCPGTNPRKDLAAYVPVKYGAVVDWALGNHRPIDDHYSMILGAIPSLATANSPQGETWSKPGPKCVLVSKALPPYFLRAVEALRL